MTHDELLAKITEDMYEIARKRQNSFATHRALRAVVELHKPIPSFTRFICAICMQRSDDDYEVYDSDYPCPTIQAIEKELK